MSKTFQRRIEDFRCANCGHEVQGDGFTNHCPRCLWSRHVDVNPGDRNAECGGMMAPVGVGQKGATYRILHRCQACGHERWNQSAETDDFDKLLEIVEVSGGRD